MIFRKKRRFEFLLAKDAIKKLAEVGGKNFKMDIKPFDGICDSVIKYVVEKEKDIWYLRIC